MANPNRDAVINNVRNSKPNVYTMTVGHGLRAFEKKTGREATDDERTMIEAVAEGFTYTFLPLFAAVLAELDPHEPGPPALDVDSGA